MLFHRRYESFYISWVAILQYVYRSAAEVDVVIP
jgi:hypothetical protein